MKYYLTNEQIVHNQRCLDNGMIRYRVITPKYKKILGIGCLVIALCPNGLFIPFSSISFSLFRNDSFKSLLLDSKRSINHLIVVTKRILRNKFIGGRR